jgi:hypothetical protein
MRETSVSAENGREAVCVGRRHAVGMKRAKGVEGGHGRKERLRADGCLERAALVP